MSVNEMKPDARKARKSPPVTPAALSPIDAAKYLGVSRATVDRLRQAGQLPACKIGGRVLFRVRTLESYLRKAEACA